jgi:hypothetical protein
MLLTILTVPIYTYSKRKSSAKPDIYLEAPESKIYSILLYYINRASLLLIYTNRGVEIIELFTRKKFSLR